MKTMIGIFSYLVQAEKYLRDHSAEMTNAWIEDCSYCVSNPHYVIWDLK